jgi:hypothetical protein
MTNKHNRIGQNRFTKLTNEEYQAVYLWAKLDLRSDHYAPLIRDQLPQSVDWEKKGRRCDWLGVVAPHEQLSTEGCSTFKKKKNGDRAKPCNATHTLPLASNQNQLSGYCMGRDMQKHSEKKNQACDADNRIVAIRFESS